MFFHGKIQHHSSVTCPFFLLLTNRKCNRYTVGQRFGQHIDESVYLGEGRRTYYTLLIYLSGTPGRTKAKSKNDENGAPSKTKAKLKNNDSLQDSFDVLVGGETVFYGPRNAIVAEVLSFSIF